MNVNTREITASLATLFSELTDGAPRSEAYVLNRGDSGLFAALDRLSAADASAIHAGGASIAAHVDHLRYGLSLMNRWAAGENPFDDANWANSWRNTTVSETEWAQLRNALRHEVGQWQKAVKQPRNVDEIELNAMIGSIIHLGYHLGAIRQMNRSLRGPAAND